MSDVPSVGQILHPVTDPGAAAGFYENVLSATTKFVDGDRYAAVDLGGTTLAFPAGAEDLTGRAAVAVRVPSVPDVLATWTEHGGTVLADAHQGPHETRAVVADPWGNAVVLYSRP